MGRGTLAGTRTPQDVRETFARNLRQLVSGERSVSALCRDAGINRTQFNRYLSGEAHPRPDVLDRICRHFGLDARILLEPLEVLRRDPPPPVASLDLEPFGDRIRGFDHRRMPDGYYRMVRPATTTRGSALASVLVLRTQGDGTKQALAAVPALNYVSAILARPWRERRMGSVVFQHINGVSLLLVSREGNPMQMYFLNPGHRAIATLYAGYAAFTQPADATHAQVVPVLAEYFGPRCADGLRVRRRCGTIPWANLRPVERDWFETWNPFGPHRLGPGE